MKLLVIGADAVTPEYIFGNKDKYPNLHKLIDNGIEAQYSAYVQKGYGDSYLSEMNWSSIYTGLEPWRHRVAAINEKRERNTPEMNVFNGLYPFWEELNKCGLTVGLWSADCCLNPVEINGYVVSSKYHMIEGHSENRESLREIQVCEKDKTLLECLHGTPPPRVYPQMLSQQGYSFEELKKNDDLAWEAIQKYHFNDSIPNFEEELEFYFSAMKEAQKKNPVDVMFFYTPTTDLIAHCCMCTDENDVLTQAYQVLDQKVGKLIDELQPENVIVMSDHGMMNFKDIVHCSDDKIRHEAFGARDEVLWLKNGYIAFEARNGALLFTAHALKGMFIAAGREIGHKKLHEMRTLDIYPTILELCGCKVPGNRNGYVLDIFNRPCINEKVLKEDQIEYREIAVIQSHNPDVTDIILNEIYLHNRFCNITIVGDTRYKEIYLHNPRVKRFVGFDEFNCDDYVEIYCGYHNRETKRMKHIQVK